MQLHSVSYTVIYFLEGKANHFDCALRGRKTNEDDVSANHKHSFDERDVETRFRLPPSLNCDDDDWEDDARIKWSNA